MESVLSEDINVTSFLNALSKIKDERENRGKHHDISFIITAVVLAILCGRSSTSSIHRFIKNRINWLRKLTQIKQAKVISRAHLPRLIDRVNWESLDQIIQQYFGEQLLPPNINQEWKAIDGKALRGTLKAGEK